MKKELDKIVEAVTYHPKWKTFDEAYQDKEHIGQLLVTCDNESERKQKTIDNLCADANHLREMLHEAQQKASDHREHIKRTERRNWHHELATWSISICLILVFVAIILK